MFTLPLSSLSDLYSTGLHNPIEPPPTPVQLFVMGRLHSTLAMSRPSNTALAAAASTSAVAGVLLLPLLAAASGAGLESGSIRPWMVAPVRDTRHTIHHRREKR